MEEKTLADKYPKFLCGFDTHMCVVTGVVLLQPNVTLALGRVTNKRSENVGESPTLSRSTLIQYEV